MTRWGYRVIQHEDDGTIWYGIHEVYKRDSDRTISWSEGPSTVPESHVLEFLRDTLTLMLAALDLPVLREDGDTLVEVEP